MGYSAIWIGVISTIGQFVAWAWLYKFIQKEGNERGLRSLSSLVAEKAGAPEAKLAAVLSVFFLAIYAAAQLTAGGKALFVMLNWPELVGILTCSVAKEWRQQKILDILRTSGVVT